MKIGPILLLFKRSGVCLKEARGLRAKTQDSGLILGNPRVSYAKPPCEGVSGNLDRTITSRRPRLDLAVERAGVDGQRALTGGLRVSATRGRADRPGPAIGVRVRGAGPSSWIHIGRWRPDLF
jgi:hypothetical protein